MIDTIAEVVDHLKENVGLWNTEVVFMFDGIPAQMVGSHLHFPVEGDRILYVYLEEVD